MSRSFEPRPSPRLQLYSVRAKAAEAPLVPLETTQDLVMELSSFDLGEAGANFVLDLLSITRAFIREEEKGEGGRQLSQNKRIYVLPIMEETMWTFKGFLVQRFFSLLNPTEEFIGFLR